MLGWAVSLVTYTAGSAAAVWQVLSEQDLSCSDDTCHQLAAAQLLLQGSVQCEGC